MHDTASSPTAAVQCSICDHPVRDEDRGRIAFLITTYGATPGRCLNCTLEELELLDH